MEQTLVIRADLNMAIAWDTKPAVLNASVYELMGHGPDATGAHTVPLFTRKGADISMDMVDDVADAEPLFTVWVRFDGCAHFTFGAVDNPGYVHLCGAEHMARFQAAMRAVYDLAAEHIPGFCGDRHAPA